MYKKNIVFDSEVFLKVSVENYIKSGVFYVTYNIAKKLLEHDNINLFFYCERKYKLILEEYLKNLFNTNNIFIINENTSLWLDIDIFYSSFYQIPNFINKNKLIYKYITIHDLIPIIFKNYYPKEAIESFEDIISSIDKNCYCFSISENTKTDIIKYVKNINKDRIYIIYNGNKEWLSPSKENKIIYKKYNIPSDKKYILSLSNIEERKNLKRIITTFSMFVKKNNINNLILVLAGKNWNNFLMDFINTVEKHNNVYYIGYVDENDLSSLYSNAEWLVYTPEYEGFGLPVIEAMSCGCPVITSSNSSLKEIVGNNAITVEWNNDEQHIHAYEKYYYDLKFRNNIIKNGLEHSKLFNWEHSVNNMLKIIEDNFVYKKHCFYIVKCVNFYYIKIFSIRLSFPVIFNLETNRKYISIVIFGIKFTIKKR